MIDSADRPIVVGIDGSVGSIEAARWAVDEARLRGCAIRLVYVYWWPVSPVPLSALPPAWTEETLRRGAEGIVAEAVEQIRAAVGDVAVTGDAVPGLAANQLIEASDRARMIVVGHRGHGGFAALRLGSVAAKVAAHAHCPVGVIRPTGGAGTAASGPVLVGVDGSPPSDAALGFAFEEADRRGAAVTAMHSWEPQGPPPPGEQTPWEVFEARRLRDWVAPWHDKYPNVMVEQYVTSDPPAAALVDAARNAALLVVGCRGHGGFADLLLGSVSHQVIRHAPCPVVVVR